MINALYGLSRRILAKAGLRPHHPARKCQPQPQPQPGLIPSHDKEHHPRHDGHAAAPADKLDGSPCPECEAHRTRPRNVYCPSLTTTLATLALAIVFVFLFVLAFNQGFLLTLATGVPLGHFSASRPPAPLQSKLPDVITVASIFKNEGRYMREWIEHHLALGVDSFLLFDDTAPNDPYPSRHILAPYIRSGQVELLSMREWDDRMYFLSSGWGVAQSDFYKRMPMHLLFHSKQQRAIIAAWHRILARTSPHQHHWLALLDLDEFYNPHGQDLKAQLRCARLRGARTVRMGKLDFVTSAIVRRPEDGTLRPHYIYRDAVPERIASITLVGSITGMAPYCIHTFEVNSILGELMFSGGIDCNLWPGNHVSGELKRHIYYAPPEQLAVHHYKTKSLEECCEHQRVVAANSLRIKDRKCRADTMSEVCDDSLLQYVAGVENSHPCATEPSPVEGAKVVGDALPARDAAAAAATTTQPSAATPFYRYCDRLLAELEVERAVAARIQETEAWLEKQRPGQARMQRRRRVRRRGSVGNRTGKKKSTESQST
jgi:hypothetical protein